MGIAQVSDRKIPVKVEDLLETMRENREEHERIYKEAVVGYRTQCVNELRETLEGANQCFKQGDGFADLTHVQCLRPPVEHLQVYDEALQMFEWGEWKEGMVELDIDEFRSYVLDEWSWMDSFLTSSSTWSEQAVVKVKRRGRRR